MPWSRRHFLRSVAISSGAMAAPSLLASQQSRFDRDSLVVLHTNDVHSRVDPFPARDKRYGGQGGVLGRINLIKKVREQYANVLLLDAGDIFQGTPYFNFFKGELEIKLMSEMGYDAATMGNHDFDAGIEGFVKQLPHARFPFLCSNYDFSQTELHGLTRSNVILKRGEYTIGLFGIGIELQGLVPKNLYGETRWLDPIEIAKEQSVELRRRGCDIIICLSHLGYRYKNDKICDVQLARRVPEIDLILGGHTHTFLETADEVQHENDSSTYIAQAGWAGLRLGMIRFGKKDERIGLRSSDNLAVYA